MSESMVERVTRAISIANIGEYTSGAQATNMALAAIDVVADEIDGLVARRKIERRNHNNGTIASVAGWIRQQAALNEQVAG